MRQEDSDPREIWQDIIADLERARSALPSGASDVPSVAAYLNYVEHNELELACDELQAYSESNAVTKEFWLALCDAAVKMALYERASVYEGRAAAASPADAVDRSGG